MSERVEHGRGQGLTAAERAAAGSASCSKDPNHFVSEHMAIRRRSPRRMLKLRGKSCRLWLEKTWTLIKCWWIACTTKKLSRFVSTPDPFLRNLTRPRWQLLALDLNQGCRGRGPVGWTTDLPSQRLLNQAGNLPTIIDQSSLMKIEK